jgi:hypothetical protein
MRSLLVPRRLECVPVFFQSARVLPQSHRDRISDPPPAGFESSA